MWCHSRGDPPDLVVIDPLVDSVHVFVQLLRDVSLYVIPHPWWPRSCRYRTTGGFNSVLSDHPDTLGGNRPRGDTQISPTEKGPSRCVCVCVSARPWESPWESPHGGVWAWGSGGGGWTQQGCCSLANKADRSSWHDIKTGFHFANSLFYIHGFWRQEKKKKIFFDELHTEHLYTGKVDASIMNSNLIRRETGNTNAGGFSL